MKKSSKLFWFLLLGLAIFLIASQPDSRREARKDKKQHRKAMKKAKKGKWNKATKHWLK